MQISTSGLVLRQVKVGEADQILTILTPDRGVLSASARGSLRLEIQCGEGGIAIYGRNAGRFPIDIEVRPALQKAGD